MRSRRTRPAPARILTAAAFLLAGTALASAQSANRIAVPDVDRTPVRLCAGGSTRFVSATRELPLPAARYFTDPDWRVRSVERDNRNS